MSMTAEYRQLTTVQLERLMDEPDSIDEFIDEFDADDDFEDSYDDDDDDDFGDDEESSRGDNDDEDDEDEDEDEDEYAASADRDGDNPRYFSLGRACEPLHLMLPGQAREGSGPLHDALFGAQEVANGARVLMPDEVRAASAALNKVNKAEFKKKFDAKAAEGYDVRELERALRDLTAFYEESAENGFGMLITTAN
jgi:hypothetical protein